MAHIEKRYNSEISLSGGVYVTFIITAEVLEQLFVSCSARILPFETTDNLPFSETGGVI
jgi:hypothetical protein